MNSCNASVAQYTNQAIHCSGSLPYTGYSLILVLIIGIALVVGGLWLKRKQQHGRVK